MYIIYYIYKYIYTTKFKTFWYLRKNWIDTKIQIIPQKQIKTVSSSKKVTSKKKKTKYFTKFVKKVPID